MCIISTPGRCIKTQKKRKEQFLQIVPANASSLSVLNTHLFIVSLKKQNLMESIMCGMYHLHMTTYHEHFFNAIIYLFLLLSLFCLLRTIVKAQNQEVETPGSHLAK